MAPPGIRLNMHHLKLYYHYMDRHGYKNSANRLQNPSISCHNDITISNRINLYKNTLFVIFEMNCS